MSSQIVTVTMQAGLMSLLSSILAQSIAAFQHQVVVLVFQITTSLFLIPGLLEGIWSQYNRHSALCPRFHPYSTTQLLLAIIPRGEIPRLDRTASGRGRAEEGRESFSPYSKETVFAHYQHGYQVWSGPEPRCARKHDAVPRLHWDVQGEEQGTDYARCQRCMCCLRKSSSHGGFGQWDNQLTPYSAEDLAHDASRL